MISGCHSEQTSADVVESTSRDFSLLPNPKGKAGGACTSALLDILYEHHHRRSSLSFQQLLLQLRSALAQRGFDQIPQLTSSRPLEMQQTPFSCISPYEGNPQTPHQQNCRRALLVGINYRGQSGELSGCQNDVYRMRDYLCQVQGYLPSNVVLLVDDGKAHYPNRKNIISVLQQLVLQSTSGDSVFFHYSGHGGLLEPSLCNNAWKRSVEDYDEILYPLDHKQAGHIRDYSLFRHFVKPMPAGVTVTCVMDCCHSGGVLDLPYSYKATPGGTIAMERSMGSLNNLALLYLLAGGRLPGGGLFHNVSDSIQGVTGESVESLQGAGMTEEDAQDGITDFTGDNGGDVVAESIENDITADDLGDDDIAPGDLGENDIGADDLGENDVGTEDIARTGDFPEPMPPPDPLLEPPVFDTNGNPISDTGLDGPIGAPPIFDSNGDQYGGGDAVYDTNNVPGYDDNRMAGFAGNSDLGFMQASPYGYDQGGRAEYEYGGTDYGGMGDNGEDADCDDCGGCISELLQNLADDE